MKILSLDQISLIELVHSSVPAAVYLAGGVVRDIFLGATVAGRDLDFIVEGSASDAAEACQKRMGGEVRRFPDFLTAKIVRFEGVGGIKEVDFASSRCEVYLAPGRLPKVSPCPIKEDLKRRDFTINALALPLAVLSEWLKNNQQSQNSFSLSELEAGVIDLFAGLEDVRGRRIKVLHPGSFLDDPTRIYRACRYAERIGGTIEEETAFLLREALEGNCLATISDFRKLTELKKIFAEDSWFKALSKLRDYGVLSAMGWLDSTTSPAVFKELKVLTPLRLEQQGDLLLKVFLLRLADWHGFEWARNYLQAFQVPKKTLATIEAEWKTLQSEMNAASLKNLSATGLLYLMMKNASSQGEALDKLLFKATERWGKGKSNI